MKNLIILLLALTSSVLTSCGSFGEGLLAGLSGMGGGMNYGMGYNYAATNGGNMNYLLNPQYAAAQTAAQYNQMNQVGNMIAAQTINQTIAQEEREYQQFCQGFKKPDGSCYTKDEWRAMKGQAINELKYGNSSSNSTYTSSSSSSSSERRCVRSSASDYAHCGGSGICQKCNGKKKYYDTSFGNARWVDPCPVCNGTGKCPGCNGTGVR